MDQNAKEDDAMSRLRRGGLKIVVFVVLVGGIAIGVTEGLHWWRHVIVTNAWIDADFTIMGSGVNGRIARIEVRKGDTVKRGDLLAIMDSEIAELNIASIDANLAKGHADKARVEAELSAFQRDMADRAETLQAVLKFQARELQPLRRRHTLARKTVKRNDLLIKRRVISKQTADRARDQVLDIEADIRSLETKMAKQRRKLVDLEGYKSKEAIFQSRIAVIERANDELIVQQRRAKSLLRKMHIYAPIDAVVNEVYVNASAYVEDGDQVFLLHDPRKLWIEGLVDDSEVRHVVVGQRVDINVDAYPHDEFKGRVAAVGQVTVGAMTNNNAANRAAPRIPVIIDLEPTDQQLWPGVRATVNIRIR